MAKGSSSGFNAKDTGNITSGPKSTDLGVPRPPARTTMNDDAVRSAVAKNPSGG